MLNLIPNIETLLSDALLSLNDLLLRAISLNYDLSLDLINIPKLLLNIA